MCSSYRMEMELEYAKSDFKSTCEAMMRLLDSEDEERIGMFIEEYANECIEASNRVKELRNRLGRINRMEA